VEADAPTPPATLAAIFPGHGAASADLGAYVLEHRPDLHELALGLCGADPFARAAESTRFLQPAVFCTSIAASAGLEARPSLAAGHSLGEFAALALAGALDAHDGLRLVVRRGELCAQAAADAGPSGMLALLARDPAKLELVRERTGVTLAGENGPGQIVVSGSGAELDAVQGEAAQLGVHASRLPVEVPFHTPAMSTASFELAAALGDVEFSEPDVTVLSCISAQPFCEPRRELAEALVRPFRWGAVVEELRTRGAATFVEVGPGRMLGALVRRIVPAATIEFAGP
jgi:[acyl-carrier-protein] S-malonyltransferase